MLITSLTSVLAQLPSWPWLESVLHAPVIVLVMTSLLAFFFLVCLILLLKKSSSLSAIVRENTGFLAAFHGAAHPLALLHNNERHLGSPLSRIYFTGSRELAFHLLGTDVVDRDFLLRLRAAGKIVPAQMNSVRDAVTRAIIEEGPALESGLGGLSAWLGTVPWLASLTPLFVWLELQTSTTALSDAAVHLAFWLSLVPVALALLGTSLCLLVLHLLSLSVCTHRRTLAAFALELGNVFDRHYVDFRQPLEHLPSISSFGPPDTPSFSLPPGDTITAVRPAFPSRPPA